MDWMTVSLLLVLFLGTGCCQEPDAGSTAEDSLEANDRQYPDELEMMCADLEKDKSANDTEGIPITIPGLLGQGQTSRYRLFTSPRTFRYAQCRCRAIHGKLVTIVNAKQNRQIQQTVRHQNACVGRVWIGLKKARRASRYTSTDGSKNKFRNWAKRQPARWGTKCGALCIQTGKWRSLPCAARLSYLCRV